MSGYIPLSPVITSSIDIACVILLDSRMLYWQVLVL
jgi:hypothetical protein